MVERAFSAAQNETYNRLHLMEWTGTEKKRKGDGKDVVGGKRTRGVTAEGEGWNCPVCKKVYSKNTSKSQHNKGQKHIENANKATVAPESVHVARQGDLTSEIVN